MKLGEKIVKAAREYIGTPWHHSARLKGVGIDCIGLLYCTAKDVGIEVVDYPNYGRSDEFKRMVTHIKKYCVRINRKDEWEEGDIIVFRGRMMLNHCAIYSGEGNMIHAYDGANINAVVEQPLNDNWRDRIHSIYRYSSEVAKS